MLKKSFLLSFILCVSCFARKKEEAIKVRQQDSQQKQEVALALSTTASNVEVLEVEFDASLSKENGTTSPPVKRIKHIRMSRLDKEEFKTHEHVLQNHLQDTSVKNVQKIRDRPNSSWWLFLGAILGILIVLRYVRK